MAFLAFGRRWQLWPLALMAGTCLAQDSDPLKSARCLQALDALQAQETALLAAAPPRAGTEPAGSSRLAVLASLRQRAALACLGSRADAAPAPRRTARPPVGVAPGAPLAAMAQPAAAGVVPALGLGTGPPPVPVPPLRTVTACDATGCWANDGTRLLRLGPALVGPQGVCTLAGAVLSCP